MNYRRQSSLFECSKIHGGTTRLGKRKIARPIVTRRPMHIVLRSSKAKGKWSLHTQSRFVEGLVRSLAANFHVRIFEFSNSGNHLHLLVQAEERNGLKAFLMVLSGRLAQRMTGSRKGKQQGFSFWDHIPFTRIVEWGRDFFYAHSYVIQNKLEAVMEIPFEKRRERSQKHTIGPPKGPLLALPETKLV